MYVNPDLFELEIEPGFYVVHNPHIHDGTKIINQIQKLFLSLLKENTPLPNIMSRLGLSSEELSFIVSVLSKKKIISEDNDFEFKETGNPYRMLDFWVHATDSCNLSCSYCYIHTKSSKKSLSLSDWEMLLSVIKNTANLNQTKNVNLRIAGGEPFINFEDNDKKIQYLIESLGSDGINVSVVFLTNMTILNERLIKIIKLRNYNISVSLDGIGKSHNANRVYISGRGTFSTVYSNILNLLDSGIKPGIMSVISNQNLDDLHALTEFLINNRLGHRYSLVHGQEIDRERVIKVMNGCYDLYESAVRDGYNFSELHCFCDLKFNRVGNRNCGKGRNSFSVYANGELFFCQKLFGNEPASASIYNIDDLTKINSEFQKKYDSVSSECLICKWKNICNSGCPLTRKDGIASDCGIFLSLIPRIIKIRGVQRMNKIKINISQQKV